MFKVTNQLLLSSCEHVAKGEFALVSDHLCTWSMFAPEYDFAPAEIVLRTCFRARFLCAKILNSRQTSYKPSLTLLLEKVESP